MNILCISHKNGWAEQSPEDWYNAAIETLKSVVSTVNPDDIAGIGISGQIRTCYVIKTAMLRPSIIWCDQRTSEECTEIERLIGRERLIEITANPAMTGFTAAKSIMDKKHEPGFMQNAGIFFCQKDYVRYKLTGELATDVSDAKRYAALLILKPLLV